MAKSPEQVLPGKFENPRFTEDQLAAIVTAIENLIDQYLKKPKPIQPPNPRVIGCEIYLPINATTINLIRYSQVQARLSERYLKAGWSHVNYYLIGHRINIVFHSVLPQNLPLR